jgi:hypothetical protein
LLCEPSLLAVLNFFHGIRFPPRFFEEQGVALSEAAYTAPLRTARNYCSINYITTKATTYRAQVRALATFSHSGGTENSRTIVRLW